MRRKNQNSSGIVGREDGKKRRIVLLISSRLTVFPAIFLLLISNLCFSQSPLCPPNFDFEQGDFTNWESRYGMLSATGDINWEGTGEISSRHTIIQPNDTELDMYGLFPKKCPNGSGYSVKLGNEQSGAQVESISYTYTIPANATTFSVLYHYAVVLQDPNHLGFEQPRFIARIIDEGTGLPVDCVSFDFTSSASLPGFQQSSVGQQVLFKDWTPISVDLGAYAGKTIRLEFITTDCTKGGHFGYAYIDVDAGCTGSIGGNILCEGDQAFTLTAPFGYNYYLWYGDANFATPLGNTQNLYLNPVPAVGDVYAVIVTPFPGFGCVDTLYATIGSAVKPPSDAGVDKVICSGQQMMLGATPTPGYTYIWTPNTLLANGYIANPVTVSTMAATQQFIVKTTDLSTGCFSFDTTIVRIISPDTVLSFTGKLNYCTGETINTTLRASTTDQTIQWHVNDAIIPGATNTELQATGAGNYFAQIQKEGCVDSTRSVMLTMGEIPQPDFTFVRDTQCVDVLIDFTNTSSIPGPPDPLTYLWKFSDGQQSAGFNMTKTFTGTGLQTIRLIATSSQQCKDSIEKTIRIMPNSIPDFTWDSICINQPALFTNLTNENGSADVSYQWTFGSNALTSQEQDPVAINFTQSGLMNVQLTSVAVGCENAPKEITKLVRVNRPAPSVRYRNVRVAKNFNTSLQAKGKDVESYEWQPQIQLNDYTIQTPVFNGTSNVEYLINIHDKYNCTSTDTLQVYIMDKTGIYLPSAFTPNSDGLNDIIKPYLVGMKGLKRFSIYNRYGQVVFQTTREDDGWDGSLRGRVQENGVYVWIVEYINGDDQSKVEKGTITLIR